MRMFFFSLLLIVTTITYAQQLNSIVTQADVRRIETALSSDEMQGRKAFTPSIDKAADFISDEFKKIGLQPLAGVKSYKQAFSMVKTKTTSTSASFSNQAVDAKNVIALTCSPDLDITEKSGYTVKFIQAGANYTKEVNECRKLNENVIVFVDSSFASRFGRLNYLKQLLFKSPNSIVFVLGRYDTNTFSIRVESEVSETAAANVVGVLPGKSKKNEIVVFSAHYDHLGIDKPVNNDSIYNGANDDASGITAIIEMAKYYKAAKNNERTLIFAAFTAEEIGGYGSQYFSQQLDPNQVVAMFNMEMIGTESKWGKNSAYITGFDKSNMGEILQRNLKGSNFTFYPDPYTEQNLFYRSDNATLARLSVPAHTISTSKMDSEPNYHKSSDEVGTLDLANMTEIIKSVIISSKTIISGTDTPTRVQADQLTR